MLITKTTAEATESSAHEVPASNRHCHPVCGSGSHSRAGQVDRRGRTGHQSDKPLTLATAAREYIWLYDVRHGIGVNDIADRERVSLQRVYKGLKRARAMDKRPSEDAATPLFNLDVNIAHDPRLIPLFPIGPYTPQSACPHLEAIEQGSALCCMVCHSSGMDAHPALRRDPRTDPAPEPKAEPAPNLALRAKTGESPETRKQRRRRMFAQQTAPAPSRSE
jgi:hypothetical protein